MATTDVPGSNPANGDALKLGCWSESKDGSLLLVEGFEQGLCTYCLFDLSGAEPIQYRDRMVDADFRALFVPPAGTPAEWTWHDKTPFPWDRVIRQGARPGLDYASAGAQLSAAERLRQRLIGQGRQLAQMILDGPQARAQAASHGEDPAAIRDALTATRDAVARLEQAISRLTP